MGAARRLDTPAVEILISASCFLAVSMPYRNNEGEKKKRNNEGFLNQLNLKRFEFYVRLMTLWKKMFRETKMMVEDTKNYFNRRF